MLTLAVLACLVASEAGGVPEAARSDDMVPWDACEGVRVFSGIPHPGQGPWCCAGQRSSAICSHIQTLSWV